MNKMQEVAEVFQRDMPKSRLAESVNESIKFVEESAYAKLVK